MPRIYPEHRDQAALDPIEPPVSISHFVSVLSAYRATILVCLTAVALAYAIVALSVYLLKPAQRITSLTFHLDFTGASEGRYPNGAKFSTSDIINTPVLLKVHEANGLAQYVPFPTFARSVFIVEQNKEYERLQSEYQARLADPKLSAVDRERIEKEFDSKRQALTKDDYSISYLADSRSAIPQRIVRKALTDILREWALHAVSTRRGLLYDVPVLTPRFVDVPAIDPRNYIAALQLLRSKVTEVQMNLARVADLPGVQLAKTRDNTSVQELQLQLDDLLRFQLEPLIAVIRASGLIGDRTLAVQLLESQVAYDERRLRSAQQEVTAIREALASYTGGEPAPRSAEEASPKGMPSGAGARNGTAGDIVMPQLSDSFIDRLSQMTNRAADQKYRERLSEELKSAALAVIPAQEAADYDRQLLAVIRSTVAKTANASGDEAVSQIAAVKSELRTLISKINEIHLEVSKNLNPSTILYTIEGPPNTRLQRAVSITRLALYGILAIAVSLPLITIGCLLHNRVREEEYDALRFREEGHVAEAGNA